MEEELYRIRRDSLLRALKKAERRAGRRSWIVERMLERFRDDPEVSYSDCEDAYEKAGLAREDEDAKKTVEELEWELQVLEHEWHMAPYRKKLKRGVWRPHARSD
jgi:hypothetical protein